jgi:hypothetical protein
MNQLPLKLTVELRVNMMAARPTASTWLHMHKYVTLNKHVHHLGSLICHNSHCLKEVIRVKSIEMEETLGVFIDIKLTERLRSRLYRIFGISKTFYVWNISVYCKLSGHP